MTECLEMEILVKLSSLAVEGESLSKKIALQLKAPKRPVYEFGKSFISEFFQSLAGLKILMAENRRSKDFLIIQLNNLRIINSNIKMEIDAKRYCSPEEIAMMSIW
ncbi:MAG: hypothetical protein Hyperionvirus51_2 [Hyperionvirus sp.]|uniref:Uncharacterized protein n=1 Tax=Hyperionvirus sp. TaxID=2487770 RepID=A0A3G5ACD7_9VIRU|nr:MAG: hypothetical protein Hyperionvirus51_2 [Hyperionvirus sp.]